MTADDARRGSLRATMSKLVASTPSRLASRFSIVPITHRAYWRWRLALGSRDKAATVSGTTARFVVSTWSERKRLRDFGGEQFVLEQLLEDLTGSETVWDVGACVGTYACFAAQRLPEGHVVAFEPEPMNRSRLRENLYMNAEMSRWDVSEAALFDFDGEATLTSEFVEVGGGHHHISVGGNGLTVRMRRGDTLIAEGVPVPDILKMDVQGAELQVLHGMGESLENVHTIYAELHTEKTGRYRTTTSAVEAFLRDEGYTVDYLGEPTSGRPGVYFIKAQR